MICPGCSGCGWRPHFVETVDGETERAWELCSECKVGDAFPPRVVFSAKLLKVLVGDHDSGRPRTTRLLEHPDTGLKPKRGAKDKHNKAEEVQQFWVALKDGDWLVFCQHAPRGKVSKKDWWGPVKERFACAREGTVEVDVEIFRAEEITSEVILL